MPKSFLFTHRRYNASPIPTADESSISSSEKSDNGVQQRANDATPSKAGYPALPASPGRATDADKLSPGRPQSARISPMLKAEAKKDHIPEEMYNLLQLAEVSVATSGREFRSVLERWQHQREELARVLKTPTPISIRIPLDPPMDKPLDLSRDPAESRILTPSPSPTPSDEEKAFHDEGRSGSSSPDETASSVTSECKVNDVHGDGHECPDCGKRYSTSSNLARHRQTHRSPADQKARRCPHCDKVYVSVPAFSMHVRTHSQGCKCPYCGKSFSRPWLLQGHIRTHTGEKPFSCQICEKAFADKSNLRAHIQTHSNLKPFTCQRCGKAFALKSYLYKHEESSCMKMAAKTKAD